MLIEICEGVIINTDHLILAHQVFTNGQPNGLAIHMTGDGVPFFEVPDEDGSKLRLLQAAIKEQPTARAEPEKN